jgi:hypothetical protein
MVCLEKVRRDEFFGGYGRIGRGGFGDHSGSMMIEPQNMGPMGSSVPVR